MEGSASPVTITLDKIAQIRTRLQNGEELEGLDEFKEVEVVQVVEKFADVTGEVTLKTLEKPVIKSARRTAIKIAATTNDRKRTIRKVKTDRTQKRRWQQTGEQAFIPQQEPKQKQRQQQEYRRRSEFMSRVRFIWIAGLMLGLAACEQNRIFEQNLPVDVNGWSYTDPKEYHRHSGYLDPL